jgi:hypothetical protein
MKMGEYETWMNDLSTVTGLTREMLNKAPALVLFALNSAIEERDRAKAMVEAFAVEIDRSDNECRTLGCKRKSAYPAKESA